MLWWVLDRKGIFSRYNNIIKNVYHESITRARCAGSYRDYLPITVSLHQSSNLSNGRNKDNNELL